MGYAPISGDHSSLLAREGIGNSNYHWALYVYGVPKCQTVEHMGIYIGGVGLRRVEGVYFVQILILNGYGALNWVVDGVWI